MADEKRDTSLNLYQRLLGVMEEMDKVPKSGRNEAQRYSFIEQAVLMAKLRPICVQYGVMIFPEILETQYRHTEGSKMVIAQCNMRITVVNVDKPEERLELLWSGEGGDTGDKAVNKAGTSGLKYAIMKMFLVSDKDDPDAEDAAPQPAYKPKFVAKDGNLVNRETGDVREPLANRDQLSRLANLNTALGKGVVQYPADLTQADAANYLQALALEFNNTQRKKV